MLAVIGTASIVFYAAAAALALIYAVVFFVALFRKKRRRNAGDVIMIILGAIVMLAALCAGAFAAVNMYKPFGVSVADESGALNLFYNGKKLFGVPKIGLLIGFFDEFALIGIIVPAALLFVCLVSVITLGVKTRKSKKIKDKPEDLRIRADEPTEEESEFVADESPLQEIKAEQEESAQEENTFDDVPNEFVTESEEEVLPSEEELPPLEEDGLPPADDTDVTDENVLNIFDEINKLVPGAEEGGEGASIDDELKKAIEEGYALSDTLSRPADFGFEETDGEYPYIEDEEREEESAEEENIRSEEQEPEEEAEEAEEESTDGWAYDETEEEPENSYETKEEESPKPEEQYSAPTPKPQRKVTPIESAVKPAARVRTIIRRPTAKSIEDIEKRAESILEHSEAAREKPTEKRAEEPTKKATAQKSKAQSAPKRKPAAKKSKPQTETKAEYKPEEDVKPVEAKSGGLPLTRKYIILNRRSAATIFNEYLNSKRESEKEELKGSLNTIIMK